MRKRPRCCWAVLFLAALSACGFDGSEEADDDVNAVPPPTWTADDLENAGIDHPPEPSDKGNQGGGEQTHPVDPLAGPGRARTEPAWPSHVCGGVGYQSSTCRCDVHPEWCFAEVPTYCSADGQMGPCAYYKLGAGCIGNNYASRFMDYRDHVFESGNPPTLRLYCGPVGGAPQKILHRPIPSPDEPVTCD